MIGGNALRSSRIATVILILVIGFGAGSCGGDSSSSESASRNSSNRNGRTLATFGREVPTLPDADVVTSGAVQDGVWRRTYEVPVVVADVVAFYQRELPSVGWTERGPATPMVEGATATTTATWRRTGFRLDITVANAPAGTDPSTTMVGAGVSTVTLSLQRR